MSTRLVLYPYNPGSQSARELAANLDIVRVRPDGTYRFRRGHKIINWGNSTVPQWATPAAYEEMLNKPQYVALASNKIQTFQALSQAGIRQIPPFTVRRAEAGEWFRNPFRGKKNAVVCRTLTRANSGRGIVLASSAAELVDAPLYTRYIPKQQEFRIHVGRDIGVIDMQEKRKRNGFDDNENANQYIRSHDNGWVFCREGINVPENVKQAALDALAALRLDFAAVDIGYHAEFGPIIYELNTAPGIEGQTLEHYARYFQRYLV